MTRFVYAVISHLSLPVFFGYLLYRGFKEPAYRARRRERFGFLPANIKSGSIWFHTVSAGEAIAAIPIIENVLHERVGEHVLVTTTTPTGYDAMRKRLGSRIDLCYVPYDIPSCVNRFLERTRPRVLFLLETELWPNLINRTASSGIPVYLLNARLSEKSAKGYTRLGSLTKSMFENIRVVACQYQDTMDRFHSLGLTKQQTVITGNVKFDLTDHVLSLTDDIRAIKEHRNTGVLIWLAGSTHSSEEEVVLNAHKSVLLEFPSAKLILAPRHVSRADEILSECKSQGLSACLSSLLDLNAEVVVIDQMGILFTLYQCASVAFVGGSLQHTGGHNPIEPAFHGLPILMGPNRRNFAEVCTKFAKQECLFTVSNAAEIAERVLYYHQDPAARAQCSKRARGVVQANQGALKRVCTLVNSWLDQLD